jgi:hypothetical protein
VSEGVWPLGVTGLHPLDGECSSVSGSNYLIKDIFICAVLSVGSITKLSSGKEREKKMSNNSSHLQKKLGSSILEALKCSQGHPIHPSVHLNATPLDTFAP